MTSKSQTGRALQVIRPAEGGMRVHLDLLCRRLPERGFQVEIAAPPGFTADVSTPVHIVPITAAPRLAADLRAATRLKDLAAQFDLVHAHGLRAAWIAALGLRRGGPPFVLTAHNLAPNPLRTALLPRVLARWTAARARSRIAVSQAVAASFAPLGIREQDWSVIPGGIDLQPYETRPSPSRIKPILGVPPERPLVVSVGRLAVEKGFDILVKAAGRDELAGLYFALAGEGPERPHLERLIAEGALAERFRLLGRVEDVPPLLAAADVFVAPSRQEGQGLAAIEAMAAGCPVIAAAVGGLAETIVHGETGLLIPPEDVEALAAALRALLEDPALRARLGAAGRKRALQCHSADRMADRIADLYRQILERENPSSIRPRPSP